MARIDMPGPCAGTDKPKEKAQTGRHQWAAGKPGEWRPCKADCSWEINARAEKYRQRFASGEYSISVRKAAPCNAAASAPVQREHDWGGSFDELGYQHCMQPGCFVMTREVDGVPWFRTSTNPRLTMKPRPCGVAP